MYLSDQIPIGCPSKLDSVKGALITLPHAVFRENMNRNRILAVIQDDPQPTGNTIRSENQNSRSFFLSGIKFDCIYIGR